MRKEWNDLSAGKFLAVSTPVGDRQQGTYREMDRFSPNAKQVVR